MQPTSNPTEWASTERSPLLVEKTSTHQGRKYSWVERLPNWLLYILSLLRLSGKYTEKKTIAKQKSTGAKQKSLHKTLMRGIPGAVAARAAALRAEQLADTTLPRASSGNNRVELNQQERYVRKTVNDPLSAEEEEHIRHLTGLFGNRKFVPDQRKEGKIIKPYETYVPFQSASDREKTLENLDNESLEAIILTLLFQFTDLHSVNIGVRPTQSKALASLYEAKSITAEFSQGKRQTFDVPTLWNAIMSIAAGSHHWETGLTPSTELTIEWRDGSFTKAPLRLLYPLKSAETELVLFDTDRVLLETNGDMEWDGPTPAVRNALLSSHFAEQPLPKEFLEAFEKKLLQAEERIHHYVMRWNSRIRQDLSRKDNERLDAIILRASEKFRLHPNNSVDERDGSRAKALKSFVEKRFEEHDELWDFLIEKHISSNYTEKFKETIATIFLELSPKLSDKQYNELREREAEAFDEVTETIFLELFPKLSPKQYEALKERQTKLKKLLKKGKPLSLRDIAISMYPTLKNAMKVGKTRQDVHDKIYGV